jgi:hypothetical protein
MHFCHSVSDGAWLIILIIYLPNHLDQVNYRVLKGAACDYAKSRVASGGLTKPP